jgi:hypothetical protein
MPYVEKEDVELIRLFLEKAREDIVKLQASKGLKASGKSAEELRVETTATGGKLIDGAGYFEYQERGRGATSGGKGTTPLSKLIYEWLKYRKYGLTYKNDKERQSLAYVIARKIHQKGTYTHIKGTVTGVLSEVILKEKVDGLKQALSRRYLTKVGTDLQKVVLKK